MERRAFLRTATLASAAAALARVPVVGANTTGAERWRSFEITTRVEVINPAGMTRVWVPLPLAQDTDYHKSLGQTWGGNAGSVQVVRDAKYGAAMAVAEWPAGPTLPTLPTLEVVTRISTRDRQIDVSAPAKGAVEDAAVLKRYLEASDLIRTDGIVEATAREITGSAKTDVDKARALYEWIVDNTFRDPKVKGCGLGDIQTMLETKNLGGKCADLNAPLRRLRARRGYPRARRLRDPGRRLGGLQEPRQERRHHPGAALPRRVLPRRTRLGAGRSGRRTQGRPGREAGRPAADRSPGAEGPREALRRVGNELVGLQLRPRREAAGLDGRPGGLPHVSPGRDRREPS